MSLTKILLVAVLCLLASASVANAAPTSSAFPVMPRSTIGRNSTASNRTSIPSLPIFNHTTSVSAPTVTPSKIHAIPPTTPSTAIAPRDEPDPFTLDTLNSTTCLCHHRNPRSPFAAAHISWTYHNAAIDKTFTLSYDCNNRLRLKHGTEHQCWEFPEQAINGRERCLVQDNQKFCYLPHTIDANNMFYPDSWYSFNGHARNVQLDSSMHDVVQERFWEQEELRAVCEPACGERFEY
ncbi:hypothetical protein MMC28_008014 [Mycoblastus sanguinarius]|nr:hypothetical protein [Mycoblastus sanguinarius]